jgi:hypothetical protein
MKMAERLIDAHFFQITNRKTRKTTTAMPIGRAKQLSATTRREHKTPVEPKETTGVTAAANPKLANLPPGVTTPAKRGPNA